MKNKQRTLAILSLLVAPSLAFFIFDRLEKQLGAEMNSSI